MINSSKQVECTIEPVFDKDSRILMLGTMPSPKSREIGFFYGNPQNRFWKVMAEVLGEDVPQSIDQKKRMLLVNGIALWDVLASCTIEGASDASIRDGKPNDLSSIFDVADIKAVFCTGSKATELYRKLQQPIVGLPCTQLPSTSPANASWRLPDLVKAYRDAILPALD